MIERLEDLEEGFYIVNLSHLRDRRDLLCYVSRRGAEAFVEFPNTGPFPVVLQHQDSPNYVLLSDLRPTYPSQELKEAQKMIEFIYKNQGRLQQVKNLQEYARTPPSLTGREISVDAGHVEGHPNAERFAEGFHS